MPVVHQNAVGPAHPHGHAGRRQGYGDADPEDGAPPGAELRPGMEEGRHGDGADARHLPQEVEHRDDPREAGCGGRARYAPAEREDEERIEEHVDRVGEGDGLEGRQGVPLGAGGGVGDVDIADERQHERRPEVVEPAQPQQLRVASGPEHPEQDARYRGQEHRCGQEADEVEQGQGTARDVPGGIGVVLAQMASHEGGRAATHALERGEGAQVDGQVEGHGGHRQLAQPGDEDGVHQSQQAVEQEESHRGHGQDDQRPHGAVLLEVGAAGKKGRPKAGGNGFSDCRRLWRHGHAFPPERECNAKSHDGKQGRPSSLAAGEEGRVVESRPL